MTLRLLRVAAATLVGSTLGSLALAAGAAVEPIPQPFKGATFLLPEGAGIKPRWVVPPGKLTRLSAIFSVNDAGEPLVAYDDTLLLDPGREFIVDVERKFSLITHLASGVPLLAAGNELGVLAAPKPATGNIAAASDAGACRANCGDNQAAAAPPPAPVLLGKKGVPVAGFQPLVMLPVHKIDVLASVDNQVYAAGLNQQSGRHALYRLRTTPRAGLQDLVLSYESTAAITAVSADEQDIFVAVGRDVLRVTRANGSVAKVYTHPGASVTGLAPTAAGLAVSTGSELVLVAPSGALEIMRSSGRHQLVMRGETLYLFFNESLGVLAIDGLADLKRFNLALRPVAPGSAVPPLGVAAVRFFESGPEPDPNPNYVTTFDRTKVRRIGARIELRLPPGNLGRQGARAHRATVSWYGPNGDRLLSTSYQVATPANSAGVQVLAWIGGKTEHGYSPPHWAGRFRFADALANHYPGVYRMVVEVDGIDAGWASFTLTGTPDPDQAIVMDDLATLQALLAQGLNPRHKDKQGTPLLHDALRFGTTAAVEMLLRKGADPNDTDKEGASALAHGLGLFGMGDWRAKAELLVRHGANVNALVGRDREPLIYRASFHPEHTAFLIRHGARIDPPVKPPRTVLSQAVESDRMCTDELITLLVQRGANLNAPLSVGLGGINGQTPLGTAIYFGNRDCVAVLLAQGASPGVVQHKPARWDRSALALALEHLATATERPDPTDAETARAIVRALIAHGATVLPHEVSTLFHGEAPAFLDLPTLGRALEQLDTIPGEASGWGLKEALKYGDPAIRQMALRRSAGRVRELTVAAGDKYRLGDAHDVCKQAFPVIESEYQLLQLDVTPEMAPASAGAPAKPFLGVEFLPREAGGAYVRRPVPDGPAERGGMRSGDIVVAIAGQEIKKADDAVAASARLTPGVPVRITFRRDQPMRVPELVLNCGLVEKELGMAGPAEMNLARWLAAYPSAPQSDSVRGLLGR